MVCYPGVSRFSPAQDEEDGNKGMTGCWLCLPKPWFCLSASPPRLSFFSGSCPGSLFFFPPMIPHLLWLYSQRIPTI
jgi:hypothetical protein